MAFGCFAVPSTILGESARVAVGELFEFEAALESQPQIGNISGAIAASPPKACGREAGPIE